MAIDHVHALPPGTRFEEYRLDSVLGAGGFGITYRAYDAHLDTFVAIKEYLPAEFAARTEASTVVPKSNTDAQDYHWGLTRFLDEARTLARFNHPNLNRVLRFFEGNGTAYMVLEYVQGETLADRLIRERQLPEQALQRLLDEVLSGLEVMHEAGYVHRDIKPGNLMLRAEDGSAVVLDFGAARQAVGQRSKAITSILTPGYAPVEQYDGKVDRVGAWTDIYALGMVAYRCVSGISVSELPDAVARMLAHTKGGTTLPPAVEAGKSKYSAQLLEAIDWAIEVDEEDRPQSMDAWRQALAGSGRGQSPVKSRRKSVTQKTRDTATARNGTNWSTVALAMVIVALLGAGGWWAWQVYPEWFGRVTEDAPAVAHQQTPVKGPGEARQAVEVAETGKAPAGAGQPPALEAASQPPPAEAAAGREEPVVEPPATAPVRKAPVEDDEITRLLAAAEADLKARRLTRPVGNNAWDRYRRVLELAPANPDAIRGMDQVIDSYGRLLDAAVEKEDFDRAAGYLASIRELNPDSPVLEQGEQRLEVARQARADRLAEQERQRQAEEAARQAELERQRIAHAIEEHWESFKAAIQAEDLDGATGILAQIRELNPEEPGLATGRQRLATVRAELERQQQEAEQKQLAGEMVDIPGGTFRMGDLSGDGRNDEKPVHSVAVPAFRLGKYEVTFAQWDACAADGGCGRYTPYDEGWGRGNRPVINVSWDDIQGFIDWLNDKTGGSFRLPTEAEWEYAARAGSTTKYSWGNRIGNNRANCNGCGSRWDADRTAPVGSFSANAWGLHDMHGNVWEWVQDCWNKNYKGAPGDGSAWTSGDCSRRVLRGGSWYNNPGYLRSASRPRNSRSIRNAAFGFRLAQDK